MYILLIKFTNKRIIKNKDQVFVSSPTIAPTNFQSINF